MSRPATLTSTWRRRTTSRFHCLYYDLGDSGEGTWKSTQWFGTTVLKCPLDLWIYQEIVHETRPTLVIETGTAAGGSALFLAGLFDLIGAGRVVTIDIEGGERPAHPRVTYLTGSSTDREIFDRIGVREADRVMVVLDSDHGTAHVLEELRLYASLVTPGCYLIVEDTNLNGHPVYRDFGPGPSEAVTEFLAETDWFVVDRAREKLLLTFNPGGYLRRVAREQVAG